MDPRSIPAVAVTGVPDPLPEGLHVLDVRENDEWRYGHIAGATHIPMRDIPGRISDLQEGQTLVVCKVGARSAQVVAYLQQQGHEAVNLAGGMVDWEAAGRPMVSETGQPPQVV